MLALMVWLFFIGKRSLSTIKIISFKKSITMKILIFLTILGFFLITTAKAKGNSTKANFLKATVTTSTGVINYEATQVVVSKGNSTGKKKFVDGCMHPRQNRNEAGQNFGSWNLSIE